MYAVLTRANLCAYMYLTRTTINTFRYVLLSDTLLTDLKTKCIW